MIHLTLLTKALMSKRREVFLSIFDSAVVIPCMMRSS